MNAAASERGAEANATEPPRPLPAGAQEELRRRLFGMGFDEVRFATIGSVDERPLRDWLAAGMQGDMQWMERSADKRSRPELVLPGVQSVIMLGVNYWAENSRLGGAAIPEQIENQKSKIINPTWARYARYEDYHDTVKPALEQAGRVIEELCGVSSSDYRYYVDTGPVLEREWAARAGLGFVGKNAMLISRQHGNWLFLATIFTRLAFTPDAPVRKKLLGAITNENPGVGLLCGKCTRCLEACPTAALPRPGVVDARRCISYQTIENKGAIPRELRAAIGARIYGCDVCLEVCPWNRFAREGRRMLLVARDELTQLSLRELLELTPVRFAEVFRRTPLKRVKLAGLLRNACVVAGNSGDASLLEPLRRLARHELPLVRAHAVWAVHRLGGGELLREAREAEQDGLVLAEYAAEVD